MRRLAIPVLALFAVVAVGACSGAASPSSTAAASAPAGSASAAAGSASAACTVSSGTGTVTVSIKNFTFETDPVTAKVGDVITWTNNDSASHTATVDDGTCTTDSIAAGASGSLTFSAAGTYKYHCRIHPSQMTGTIEISG